MAKSKGSKLSKTALARQQSSSVDVAEEFAQDRAKFNSVIQDYGITFNPDNTTLSNDAVDKIDALVALLGMTFTRNGTTERLELTGNTYSNHTHDYVDVTINDTADGSGTQTDTARTTDGVN